MAACAATARSCSPPVDRAEVRPQPRATVRSSRCGSSSPSGQWGDIVGDLAGACGKVTTIISGTSVDPHDYEPTPSDLAAFTDADLVVVNGLGYDAWASRAVDAGGANAAVVDAGEVAGKTEGDNPHLWYGPDFVERRRGRRHRRARGSRPPTRRRTSTSRRRRGTARCSRTTTRWPTLGAVVAGGLTYGATEPVFAYMAQALGLVDETPAGLHRGPRRMASIRLPAICTTSSPPSTTSRSTFWS